MCEAVLHDVGLNRSIHSHRGGRDTLLSRTDTFVSMLLFQINTIFSQEA